MAPFANDKVLESTDTAVVPRVSRWEKIVWLYFSEQIRKAGAFQEGQFVKPCTLLQAPYAAQRGLSVTENQAQSVF